MTLEWLPVTDVDTKFCENLSAYSKMYRQKHCVLVSLDVLREGK